VTAPRLLGAAILAGLVGLVAVQVPELARNQRRQPFDRRLALRPEREVEALATRSRSRAIRSRYVVLYWLARQIPGATLRVPPGHERTFAPLRGLADMHVSSWIGAEPLVLGRRDRARLSERATDRLDPDGDATYYLLVDRDADEYVLAPLGDDSFVVLSRGRHAALVRSAAR
jgi:hypothetical protein